jgi:hypothetical protein
VKIPILFARTDSIYFDIPGCDVYDHQRDALTFNGHLPVIAHPPCRSWGRLRQFSKAPETEKHLAIFAIKTIQSNGGVLEHPAYSSLWQYMNLPQPGTGQDQYGGWTLPINQYCFGHLAEKKTWLYISGCSPKDIPSIPINLGYPQHCIRPSKTGISYKIVSKADREHTPFLLATWLIELWNVIHGPILTNQLSITNGNTSPRDSLVCITVDK